jgi:hypothetical protein
MIIDELLGRTIDLNASPVQEREAAGFATAKRASLDFWN